MILRLGMTFEWKEICEKCGNRVIQPEVMASAKDWDRNHLNVFKWQRRSHNDSGMITDKIEKREI